jgi:hypothetical protein
MLPNGCELPACGRKAVLADIGQGAAQPVESWDYGAPKARSGSTRRVVRRVSGADTHSSRASIDSIFISENGIVAVLGNENQFVKCEMRKINGPVLFGRGHMNQLRGNGRSAPASC